MTAVLRRPRETPPLDTRTWTIGAPRLLAGLDTADRLDLREHLGTHGPLPAVEFDRLLAVLDAVGGLPGRGGAGFPFAAKLRALAPHRRRVVVNGAESEPASRKDRVLLRRTPHLVLDGALATAAAIGAREVVVALHDETTAAAVRAAGAERADAARLSVRVTPGGFVAGEARALVRALDGGPALPPGRRTPPTDSGTVLSNAETFAQLAVLLRVGPHRYTDTGALDEPGTTLLTVGGAVDRAGVVELPTGTPLGIVLAAAGVVERPQAVVVGGYHGAWCAPIPEIRLSRAGLRSAGGTLGAGVLLVVDHGTCALGELARVAGWLAGESARQCGPCRFGLPALAADVAALAAGQPAPGGRPGRQLSTVEAALDHARAVTGRGACAHPDGAARFVTSGVHLLHDEIDRHLESGGCGRPVLGRLPIGAA
ncbi:NADH-ubiquinone oxidoreductase-F iron-sulfur binding region domain-containing protein [uncultured Jatrophihabitans sp.]|uniref:NADH-ubiquinone oxidoreductase-F iron-sulfur binding region domain-containing protein n=1 Tax=uncultured Jatrophihabitans sp. TaxID=1610747 RepID=UPI0035CAE911